MWIEGGVKVGGVSFLLCGCFELDLRWIGGWNDTCRRSDEPSYGDEHTTRGDVQQVARRRSSLSLMQWAWHGGLTVEKSARADSQSYVMYG